MTNRVPVGYSPVGSSAITPTPFQSTLPGQPAPADLSTLTEEEAREYIRTAAWTIGGAFALYLSGMSPRTLIWGGLAVYLAMTVRTYTAAKEG